MIKLPLCPYCGARFLYPEVRRMAGKKEGMCLHCKKEFTISQMGIFWIFLAVALLLIALNWALLAAGISDLWVLLAVTAVLVALSVFLIPFGIRLKEKQKRKK